MDLMASSTLQSSVHTAAGPNDDWLERQKTVAMHAASLRNRLTNGENGQKLAENPEKRKGRATKQTLHKQKCFGWFLAESAGRGYPLHAETVATRARHSQHEECQLPSLCFILGNKFRL